MEKCPHIFTFTAILDAHSYHLVFFECLIKFDFYYILVAQCNQSSNEL
jgi:hypothetical protein